MENIETRFLNPKDRRIMSLILLLMDLIHTLLIPY